MMGRRKAEAKKPIAVQRCGPFIDRTMNWLYDHLRFVTRHTPLVITDLLQNRKEFPELTAWEIRKDGLVQGIRRRLGVRSPALARLLKSSPRVLHSHFGYVAVDDIDLWKQLQVPWVIGFYGADVYALGRRAEWRERYAEVFQSCSRALALGPTMAKHIEQMGCPTEKVAVHALGVPTSELPEVDREWKRGSEPLKVLFAGTIREKKGIQYALKGVAEAIRAGVEIEMHLIGQADGKAGDDESEADVVRIIEECDLARHVHRSPYLPFSELLDLALRCHVFLAPSVTAADGDSEGTPFVIQQMMATRMPVIATLHSDIPYIFGDLKHLLVPERDEKAIAASLIGYAEKPGLLEEHGRALRNQIVAHFDVRDRAAGLSDLYDSL